MQKKVTRSTNALEVVDENNILLGYFEEDVVKKHKLCTRAYAALLGDEHGDMLFRIAENGALDLPIFAHLPARESRESALCASIAALFGEAEGWHIRQIAHLSPTEITKGSFLTLFFARLPHASFVRKTQEDANFLLTTRSERQGLLKNPRIERTPLLNRFIPTCVGNT